MDNVIRHRRPRSVVASLVIALLGATPLLVALVAEGATRTVDMFSARFHPTTLYINPGDTVRWTNSDVVSHNITMSSKSIAKDVAPGESYTAPSSFAAGTYNYFCRFHQDSGMTGSVTTNAPPPSASPSPTATVTLSPTSKPKPKPSKTATTSPRPTATATPTQTATPTPEPTPTTPAPEPTETLPTSTPLPTFAGGETGSTGGSNMAAIGAIVVVVLLGSGGYLIYRRFIASP